MSSEEGEYWNDGPGDRHSLLIIRQEGDGRLWLLNPLHLAYTVEEFHERLDPD